MMRRSTQLGCLVLAAIAAVSGCTVGPDYKGVATTMPTDWAATTQPALPNSSTTNTQAADLTNWWNTLQDPTLSTLIERAIVGNLDLKQAEARIRQARATQGIAESAYYPDVNAGASYTRSRIAASGQEGDFYRAGFDASWELDVFGGTRRSVESAKADIQASVEDRRDVLVTLLGEVASNYVQLRGLQQRIAIAEQNVAAQQRTEDLVQRQFSGGLVSRLDLTNAQAQLATTLAQIPSLQASARTQIFDIGVLLGVNPAEVLDLLEKPAAIPGVPAHVPVGLPSDLLRRRPDIRRAEAQVHGATARIGVATSDLYPRFALTGDLGVSSNRLADLSSGRFWSIGPNASWNIFSGGRVQSNIKVQEAIREQVFLGYERTVLTALRDVDVALSNYAREQERRASLVKAVEANRASVDLSTRLWREGQVDFLNVLASQRALFNAEDAYQQSTQVVALNLVSLYKALGGGWENLDSPATQPTTRP